MSLTTDQFAKALIAAGLASVDEVKQLWAALPAGERPKNGEAFASLLVQRKQLNDFQAQTLLSGAAAPLVLGDYILVGRIGAGGMGQVFQARHRHMKRIVAIKVLPAALTQDEAAIKRFQREVEAAAHLVHPNIVQAYDASVQRGVWYLVMEYVAGRDLASVSADGPLPIDRAIDYIRQAAKGLAFAHSRGVVHRDIKPANLLLDTEGCVKILDMGLARFENEIAAKDGLTQSGVVMGTIDYMAPEQAFDTHTADARADMYSLGCTLYRLLTQRNLYEADTIIQKLTAHQSKPIPSLVAMRKDATPGLVKIFEKMVAKAPEDRFQSMNELIAALDALEGKPTTGGAKPAGGSSGVASAVKASTKVEVAPTVALQHPQQATDPVSERSIQVARRGSSTREPKPKPSRNRTLLYGGAGTAAVGALLGGLFLLSSLWKDTTAQVHIPPDGSAKVVSSAPPSQPVTLPPIDFAAERKAAEWVLSAGGSITLEDEGGRPIADFGAVPPNQDFTLAGFDLTGRSELATDELRKLSLCSRLKTIVLTGTPVDDEHVAAVGLRPPLTTLKLNRTKVTDKSILEAADTATLLNIALEETATSDLGVEALTRHGRLAHISLGSAKITPDAIQRCAAANTSLWRFGVTQFPQEALGAIEDHPSLQMIDCPPHQLTPAAIRALNRCSKVVHLNVFSIGKPFPAETFDRIAQLERIRTLDFPQQAAPESITAAQFRKLKSIATLRKLSVGAGVDDAGLSAIGDISTLAKLSLGEHRCTPTAVEAFGKARPDVHLTIGGKDYPPTAVALPPIDFAAERKAAEWVLSAKGQLEIEDANGKRLELTGGKISAGDFQLAEVSFDQSAELADADLSRLAACRRLRVVTLKHPSLTDRGIEALKLRPPLAGLHLHGAGFSDATAASAAKVASLRDITLWDSTVTDSGLADLAAHGRLTRLSFGSQAATAAGLAKCVEGNPQLTTLVLEPTAPARLLEDLSAHPSLQEVICAAFQFTDPVVDALNSCPQLSTLSVSSDARPYSASDFDRFARLKGIRKIALAHTGQAAPLDARQLRKLAEIKTLSTIEIWAGCDDECLRALRENTSLTSLSVPSKYHHCTANGINEFRKARPDVHLTINGQDYPATKSAGSKESSADSSGRYTLEPLLAAHPLEQSSVRGFVLDQKFQNGRKLYSPISGKLVGDLLPADETRALAAGPSLSRDGKIRAWLTSDGELTVWDETEKKPLWREKLEAIEGPSTVNLTPDGRMVAVLTANHYLVRQVVDRRIVAPPKTSALGFFHWSPTGRRLAGQRKDGWFLFDFEQNKLVEFAESGAVGDIRFAPDESAIIVSRHLSYPETELVEFNLQTGLEQFRLPDRLYGPAFTLLPNGRDAIYSGPRELRSVALSPDAGSHKLIGVSGGAIDHLTTSADGALLAGWNSRDGKIWTFRLAKLGPASD